MDTTSSAGWVSRKSSDSSAMRPASSFDRSSMSLTMVSRFSAERRADCAWFCGSGANRLSTSRPSSPMTPLSGVRISWLILARNSDLARLAASASCLAISSVSVRRSSSRRDRLLWAMYPCGQPRKDDAECRLDYRREDGEPLHLLNFGPALRRLACDFGIDAEQHGLDRFAERRHLMQKLAQRLLIDAVGA